MDRMFRIDNPAYPVNPGNLDSDSFDKAYKIIGVNFENMILDHSFNYYPLFTDSISQVKQNISNILQNHMMLFPFLLSRPG
ncbi:hypothetical protein MTBBW1_360002 [Desulfamplus magnetovallimortis]|uniref:Uncharacterized protein n=1 Tax=Desulfamplus magnetovallimortis TaxID=1246637 RepID=A0A1W1HGH4_9BACT|nr:hypothetical protein [Desulfamplus magnetovallimortis]SLM31574.1 hypothetical protein MTBBW1_360002 [Desulfamplus magnetovallimortis]